MKRFITLFICIIFIIFQAVLVYSQNLDSLTLIAHYPLLNSPNDTTGNNDPMTLLNTPFQDGGIYCNGNNPGNDPNPCDAKTPDISDLNLKFFAIRRIKHFSVTIHAAWSAGCFPFSFFLAV